MNALFRWKEHPRETDDILLTDDPRTYELIERMIATLSECFASRKIHIGMDEAHMLGRGKFLDIHGYEKTSDIMKRHLARVLEIIDKYGYEVMLWSDCICQGKVDTKKHHSFRSPVLSCTKLMIQKHQICTLSHIHLSYNTWFLLPVAQLAKYHFLT